MAVFTIKQTILRNILVNSITQNTRIIDIAHELANDKLELEKQRMLEEFDNHKVTQEIRAGSSDPAGAKNISNTLGGNYGNLFTFIGFNEGRGPNFGNPIGHVRNILNTYTFLRKSSRGARYLKDSVRYEFEVYFPSNEELIAETPTPYKTNESWLLGIETGNLSGVPYYLHSRSRTFRTSWTGPALQLKFPIAAPFRPTGFSPPAEGFVFKILANFKKKFKK